MWGSSVREGKSRIPSSILRECDNECYNTQISFQSKVFPLVQSRYESLYALVID